MGVRIRRGGRWWWLAIISAFVLVISGSGTALALWSAQVKGESIGIGAPVLGFAVIANGQTYAAEDQTDIIRMPLDFSGPSVATTNAGSAVAFEVSLLASPGYAMDYSWTVSASGPVFFEVEDPTECTPDNASRATYHPGDRVTGIRGAQTTTRTDLWCAVVLTVPGGTYTNTVTVTGTDAVNGTTTANSTWTIGVAGVSADEDFTIDIQPLVDEEGAS